MELKSYEEAYKQIAEDAELWMSSARNLLAASDLAWSRVDADRRARGAPELGLPRGHYADIGHPQLHGQAPFLQHAAVFLMLSGFAVENALKGIRVAQGTAVVARTKGGGLRLSEKVRTHSLATLARLAEVELSSGEIDLLDRLEAFLVWAGRYPVAASASGQAAVQMIWSSDQATVRAFFDRLESEFHRVRHGSPPTHPESGQPMGIEGGDWHWRSGEGDSVQIGYVNPNGQRCCGHRGVAGTDHGQLAYKVECSVCGYVYGANGSDMHERRCPMHGGGEPGIAFWQA